MHLLPALRAPARRVDCTYFRPTTDNHDHGESEATPHHHALTTTANSTQLAIRHEELLVGVDRGYDDSDEAAMTIRK
jgi:hypothetical protein